MNKSEILFALCCIPSRIVIALLARDPRYTEKVIPFALAAAVGFMYYYLTGTRTTGAETFGRPIWWNDLRPIHAALWAIFAIKAYMGCPDAWKFLALDVILGLAAFLLYKKN